MPLLHEELTRSIIGAFYNVYNALGHGFLESVYASALSTELQIQRVPFTKEHSFPVVYKRHTVSVARVDLVVANSVIVEIKAAASSPYPSHSLNSFSSTPTQSLFCRRTKGCLSRNGSSTRMDSHFSSP